MKEKILYLDVVICLLSKIVGVVGASYINIRYEELN
jgi:hypothetical protein